MKRLSALLAAGLLLASVVGVAPVSAQGNGNGNGNSGNSGCNLAGGSSTGGGTTGGAQSNRSDSRGVLVGLINAMVSDVQALNNINVQLTDVANNPNVQVICVTDALNQNDVHILQDILNGSPILSNDLNQSLNNLQVLNNSNLLNILNGSSILGISGNTVYVAPSTGL